MDDFQPAYMGPWIPLRTDTMREVRGGVGAIIFDMTGSAAEAEHVMLNLPFNGNSIMDMNVGLLSGFLFELGVDVYVAKAVDFEVMARRRTSKLIEHWQWEALSSSVMASHMVPVDFEIADMIRAARATRGIDAIRQEDARPRTDYGHIMVLIAIIAIIWSLDCFVSPEMQKVVAFAFGAIAIVSVVCHLCFVAVLANMFRI